MNLLKAIGEGIVAILEWTGMVFKAFYEYLLPSGWTGFFLVIVIISIIIGVPKIRK